MTDLVLIVEGQGDVDAFPHIVGKISNWLEVGAYVSNPIRAGCWGAIKKPGGLEKLVAIAASRPNCERVVVVVDLDDGCPVIERDAIDARRVVLQQQHGVSIEICFCIREFEAWLLQSLPEIRARFPSEFKGSTPDVVENSTSIRGAKERFDAFLNDGYSQTSDQAHFVKGVDVATLYQRDRSFRRFVKTIVNQEYAQIA